MAGHSTQSFGRIVSLYDIKLMSVALQFMIILQNFITTNHRKSGKSKYDRKLTELDVITMRIRYRVTGS